MPDKDFPISIHLRLDEDDPMSDKVIKVKCFHCPGTKFVRSVFIGNYAITECASCGKFSAIHIDIVDFESIHS